MPRHSASPTEPRVLAAALATALILLLPVAAVASAPQESESPAATAGGDDGGDTAPRETPESTGDGHLDALEQRVAESPDDLLAGADYRQAVIEAEEYDRAIAFFEELAAEHPDSHATLLNRGYAYVDKIPAAGAVTQVILADKALRHFTAALEVEESWLALYTRGNSYVYWPAIFGRTRLGIADLEKAVERSEELGDDAPLHHAHAYAALGDAHWRLDDLESAREWWQRGQERFPDSEDLGRRLELEGDALDELLDAHYAIGGRVDTSLDELRESRE